MKGIEVKVLGVVESNKLLNVEYVLNNLLVDENGYIYKLNVNIVEEMVDMMLVLKVYEINIQVVDIIKCIFCCVMMFG